MLGDGSLTKLKDGKNSRLSVLRGAKDKEYLLENLNTFKEYCGDNPIYYRKIKNPRLAELNKCSDPDRYYESYSFNTRSSKFFTNFRKEWYPNNIKIVPKTLQDLSALTIAIWLADDGSISEYRKNKLSIIFNTNGFVKDDTLYLINLLEMKFGKGFICKLKGDKNKQQYIIVCYDILARKICDYIDDVFPKSMTRKSNIWRNVENFNSNMYIPTISKKLLINNRLDVAKKVIIEFKSNNIFSFNIKTFAKSAGFLKKDGKTMTNQSKTYINMLLKEKLIEQININAGLYEEKVYKPL